MQCVTCIVQSKQEIVKQLYQSLFNVMIQDTHCLSIGMQTAVTLLVPCMPVRKFVVVLLHDVVCYEVL